MFRINSASYFLLSSILYSLIPTLLLFSNGNASFDSVTILIFTVFISFASLPFLRLGRQGFRALASKTLFILSTGQTLGFLGFIFLISTSRSLSDPFFTLIISESWPLVAAILFPIISIGRTKRLTHYEYILGIFAIIGLCLALDPLSYGQGNSLEITALGILIPIIAMFGMGIGSTLKAKHAEIAKEKFGLNAVQSFFVLYIQMAPFALVLIFFSDLSSVTMSSLAIPSAIVFINALSAILFTYGTLLLKRSTDLFIWFLTPVFSVIFFSVITTTLPTSLQIGGISVIVACNLLASINLHNRVAFKYSTIFLLLTGIACLILPPTPMDSFYDAIAVLAIFTTLTLAFLLERVANRTKQEMDLYHEIYVDIAESDQSNLLDDFKSLFEERNINLMRRKLHKLSRLLQSNHTNSKISVLVSSRQRGLVLANLFSVSLAIFVIIVLAILSRPHGWQHSLFAMAFIPSLIYGVLYLVDIDLQRYQVPFYRYRSHDKYTYSTTSHSKPISNRQNFWSVGLIGILILGFSLAFWSS